MNLSKLALTRPIAVIMVFSAALLMGIVSLFYLPVELYPNVSLHNISIIIIVRGGIPPTEVESLVTKPIEEAVSTGVGRDHIAKATPVLKQRIDSHLDAAGLDETVTKLELEILTDTECVINQVAEVRVDRYRVVWDIELPATS